MKRLLSFCCAVFITLFTYVPLLADIVSEDFESGWTLGHGDTQTNAGWVANHGWVSGGAKYGGNYGIFLLNYSGSFTNSYVQTPLLINGAGTLTFWSKSQGGESEITFDVLTSADGTNWTSVSTITNTSSWTEYSVDINVYSDIYIKIFKTEATGGGQYLCIDDIATTEAPAKATFSDVLTDPDTPLLNDPVMVSCIITPSALASNISATLLYTVGVDSNSIPMITNATENGFITTNAIPGQAEGMTVNYTITAAFDGPDALSPTNYSSFYTATERRFFSDYKEMTLIEDIEDDLFASGNYFWEGFIDLASPLSNADLKFQGVTTNTPSQTNQWGDSDQTFTALSVAGTADLGAGAINVDNMPAGQYLVAFNETNLEYTIKCGVHEEFEDWGSLPDFGTYTNEEWIASDVLIESPADNNRKWRGKMCVLDSNGVANIRSAYMPNGIGSISFRYRNWQTNGAPSTELYVQTSETGGVSPNEWQTIHTITNISTVSYLHVEQEINDAVGRYCRIFNSTNATSARVCLDDIAISDFAPGLTISNLTHSPQSPTTRQSVDVTFDMTPSAHITNIQATLWFRAGVSGVFDSISMSDTGLWQFATDSPIPAGSTGTMHYYVEVSFLDQIDNVIVTSYAPAGGSDSPRAYTNTEVLATEQDFESGWTTGHGDTQTNAGWVANHGWVSGGEGGANYGGSYGILLLNYSGSYTNSYVQTPLLINGAGTLTFWSKSLGGEAEITFDVLTSADGTNWASLSTITNTSTWTQYSVDINVYSDIYIKIFKTEETDDSQYLCIDDILISHPPAYVAISPPTINPAYPASSDSVDISCVITSVYDEPKAFNIAGQVYYREQGGGAFSGPLAMTRSGSNHVTTVGIPAFPAGTVVEYYIESTFHGYAYEGENKSPMFYPSGGESTPLSYQPRRYSSSYSNLVTQVDGASATMKQYDDNWWQGIFTFSSNTIDPEISAQGLNYYNGSEIIPGTTIWGDSNPANTNPPLIGTMQQGGSNIVMHGSYIGQYTLRFNEVTREYMLLQCSYNDFNDWLANVTYFEESRDGAIAAAYDLNFNDWDLSEAETYDHDFEIGEDGWSPYVLEYPPNASAFGGKRGDSTALPWTISSCGVITQLLNHALYFHPSANVGSFYLSSGNQLDGIGTVSFDVRCISTNHVVTLFTNSANWTNVSILADMSATDIATNSSGTLLSESWLSIYARYQDENNYYELRISEEDNNNKRMAIYRMDAGTEESLTYSTINNSSILDADSYYFAVDTHSDKSRVMLLGYENSALRLRTSDDDAERILTPGYVGFSSENAGMKVDNVEGGDGAHGQDFNAWSAGGYDSITSADGWTVTYGAISSGSVTLETNKPSRTIANVQACYMENGIGEVRYHIRKVDGEDTRAKALLQRSSTGGTDPTEWTTVHTHELESGTGWDSQNEVDVNSTDNYFRIINTNWSGYTPARIGLDAIMISPYPAKIDEDFNDNTANGWEDDSSSWYATNFAYYVDGYTATPLGFDIQTAPLSESANLHQDSAWTNETSYSNYVNVANDSIADQVNNPDAAFFRIKHTDGGNNGFLVVDNVDVESWHAETINDDGWQATAAWIIKVDSNDYFNAVELSQLRTATSEKQSIRSPLMTSGVYGVEFEYKTQTDGIPVVYAIEQTIDGDTGTWDTNIIYMVTNTASSFESVSHTIDSGHEQYVRIREASTNENAGMIIDNVSVNSQVGTNAFTWTAYNALITKAQTNRLLWENDGNIKGAYLNDTYGPTNDTPTNWPDDMPYIQSGLMSNGVGRISFMYRVWEDGDNATIHVRTAPSRETPAAEWQTLKVISGITNTIFAKYDEDFYDATNHYVRFYTEITNESNRACLDNTMIMEPLGAELDIRGLDITPDIPLATSTVSVRAEVYNFFLNPSNISMKTYYRTGTNNWGDFTSATERSMGVIASNANYITFETTTPIPAQPIDEVVQYYVSASYEGVWSEASSPEQSREFSNPDHYDPIDMNEAKDPTAPYYVVFSCLPGQVWINELNIKDAYIVSTQYIELAGLSGVGIADWEIDILDGNEIRQGLYSVPDGTVLSNEANNHGFWVLGSNAMVESDMPLTNTITQPGAARLWRSMGALEHSICFGHSTAVTNFTAQNYDYAGEDKGNFLARRRVLMLVGNGSVVSDFAWEVSSDDQYTPGQMNIDQYFPSESIPFQITNFWTSSTSVYMVAVTDTNTLIPTPWYSTNLLTGGGWIEGSNKNWNSTGTTYTIWCDRILDVPYCFYRITATNSP